MHDRTVRIDGLDIAYRQAGPKDAPTILQLHNFPTSSHMFRTLIPGHVSRALAPRPVRAAEAAAAPQAAVQHPPCPSGSG